MSEELTLDEARKVIAEYGLESDNYIAAKFENFMQVNGEVSDNSCELHEDFMQCLRMVVDAETAQSSTITTLETRVRELENLKFGFPERNERDWEEDYKFENGQYQCRCGFCGHYFMGHKRRVQCKVCSVGLGLTQSEKLYTRSEMEAFARGIAKGAFELSQKYALTIGQSNWIDEWLSKRKEVER